jgi:hypothetical protein
MSDLFAYLDDYDIQGCPEYDYLGHFRARGYIEAGHNDLRLENQIDEGNIPDISARTHNEPAIGEPGNISSNTANPPGTGSGASSATTSSQPQVQRGGLGRMDSDMSALGKIFGAV